MYTGMHMYLPYAFFSKMTLRLRLTLIIIAIIKKKITNSSEGVDKRDPLYTAVGKVN